MPRESLLINQDEESINSNEIVLKTKQDKFKNWWHYHWYYLLIGFAAVIVAVYLIVSYVTTVRPDYEVALVSQFDINEDVRKSMENTLATYAEDINGDGKVYVQLNTYSFNTGGTSSDDAQALQANQVKLISDISSKESMIFLYEPEILKSVLGDEYTDTFSYITDDSFAYKLKDTSFMSNVDFSPIKDTDVTEEIETNFLNLLSISIRDPKYIDDENYFGNSLKLFNSIVK